MSESSLPDDLARWPSDPYRLLGVAQDVNERDLKRAYLQLIRKYKPEHAPAEFQKIRQAYETIQQFIKFGVRWNVFKMEQDNDDESLPETKVEPLSTSHAATPGDDFLELSTSSRFAEAYTRLVEAFEADAGKYQLHLKLYWSLVASPDLDPCRKPIDWLFRGLAERQGRCHASLELLRRAIEANASAAFGDLAQALIGPEIEPGFISQFVVIRWRAARKLGFWNVIRADVNNLRARSHRDLEDFWPTILTNAATQMAWSNELDFSTVRTWMREIESWGMTYKQIDTTLHELDYIVELAECRQTLGTSDELASVVSHLLPMIGDASGSNLEWVVPHLIETLARKLAETVSFLDRIIQFQPAIFAQLIRVIDGVRPEHAEIRPEVRSLDVIRMQIRAFVNSTNRSSYSTCRLALLRFCLQEAIDPELFAALVCDSNHFSKKVTEQLGSIIAGDWSLRYSYRAWAAARWSWCLRRLPT